MTKLNTRFLGLELRSPIIAGSCGLTNSVEQIRKMEAGGAGAVVLKSLFEEQINNVIGKTYNGNEANFGYPEALDYISHYTRTDDVERYLQLIRDAHKAVAIPVIASINCVSAAEWTSFASSIQEAGADALELNVFILPSDPRRKGDQNEQAYLEIVMDVVKKVKIPVCLKISPYFSGFANMAMQLSWTGIKGMVFFNRYYSPDFNIDNFQITHSNVFSAPDEYTTSLRWIAMLSKRVQCDLAASTGIHDGTAVIKQLLAGARAVQVATVLYEKGPEYIGTMLDQVRSWMEQKQFNSPDDFIGRLSVRETENPAAYERVQFMKHFSGIE